ncbi:MAG: hypothetical protein GWP09_00600, partial [Nitrospiraceae bacterium]|nr:hypothetical protein [Nitrospiraceae bacterium]
MDITNKNQKEPNNEETNTQILTQNQLYLIDSSIYEIPILLIDIKKIDSPNASIEIIPNNNIYFPGGGGQQEDRGYIKLIAFKDYKINKTNKTNKESTKNTELFFEPINPITLQIYPILDATKKSGNVILRITHSPEDLNTDNKQQSFPDYLSISFLSLFKINSTTNSFNTTYPTPISSYMIPLNDIGLTTEKQYKVNLQTLNTLRQMIQLKTSSSETNNPNLTPPLQNYKLSLILQIDSETRKRQTITHSAEHIFFGTLSKQYPSLKLIKTRLTMDISHLYIESNSDIINWQTLQPIEQKINDIIKHNISSKTIFIDKSTLLSDYNNFIKAHPGLRIKPDKIKETKVRLIEFGNPSNPYLYDISACAGTHIKTTSEIKTFFIVDYTKKTKSNQTYEYDISFTVDNFSAIQNQLNILRSISQFLNSGFNHINEIVTSAITSNKRYKEQLKEIISRSDFNLRYKIMLTTSTFPQSSEVKDTNQMESIKDTKDTENTKSIKNIKNTKSTINIKNIKPSHNSNDEFVTIYVDMFIDYDDSVIKQIIKKSEKLNRKTMLFNYDTKKHILKINS